jgi:glycosyltransferase involved in cell wall biosynthesis
MTNNGKKPVKVFLLHNQITPYRLPIFNEIGKNHPLFVMFCQTRSKDRLWESSSNGYSFSSTVLKYFKIGPFVINYTLPSFLLQHSFDVYIVGENPENFFSELIICFFSKVTKKKYVIWSEAISTSGLSKRYSHMPCKRIVQSLYNKLSSLYQKLLYKSADACIAYSKRAETYLMERGVAKGDIFFGDQSYPNFQETIKNNNQDTRLYGEKSKKIILYLGYLRYEKGVDILIHAFQKLGRNDTILIIAVDGPELKPLKDQSHDEDSINFTGYVDEDTKSRLYSDADIFVLPTFHDPWGLTVNEAMSYGLPIIVSSAAACSDHLIQGNGIIVEPGSINELAQSLQYLLDENEIRDKMGKKSSKIILEFSVRAGAKPFLEAIDSFTPPIL